MLPTGLSLQYQIAFAAHRKTDWAIIGYGPQGAQMATALHEADPNACITVVDPHKEPLQVWSDQNSKAKRDHTGRSVIPLGEYESPMNTKYPYHDLLVQDFVKELLRKLWRYQRKIKHLVANVISVTPGEKQSGVTSKHLMLSNGDTLDAKNLVLAMGQREENWPSWAKALKEGNTDIPIYHVYQDGFSLDEISKKYNNITIVGGGWSALRFADLVAYLERDEKGLINVITKHDINCSSIRGAAVSPQWLPDQPGYMEYAQLKDPAERAKQRKAAQKLGQTDQLTKAAIQKHVEDGHLNLERGKVVGARQKDYQIELFIQKEGSRKPEIVKTDCVLLATGFKDVPGGAMTLGMQEVFNLPLVESIKRFLPKLNPKTLEWGKNTGIYVTGSLAADPIGIMAGRMPGAIMASERIVENHPDLKDTAKKQHDLVA
jgi:lysine/ornithine N-monooxygenase